MQIQIFISDANAFYRDADAKYPYDAHVLFSDMQFMMPMSYAGASAAFIHDGASTHI